MNFLNDRKFKIASCVFQILGGIWVLGVIPGTENNPGTLYKILGSVLVLAGIWQLYGLLKGKTVPPIYLNPEYMRKVEELKKNGNTIQAIKLVREQSGAGLKHAKEFVELL